MWSSPNECAISWAAISAIWRGVSPICTADCANVNTIESSMIPQSGVNGDTPRITPWSGGGTWSAGSASPAVPPNIAMMNRVPAGGGWSLTVVPNGAYISWSDDTTVFQSAALTLHAGKLRVVSTMVDVRVPELSTPPGLRVDPFLLR